MMPKNELTNKLHKQMFMYFLSSSAKVA